MYYANANIFFLDIETSKLLAKQYLDGGSVRGVYVHGQEELERFLQRAVHHPDRGLHVEERLSTQELARRRQRRSVRGPGNHQSVAVQLVT